jgi:hypothetical protein
MRVGCEEQYRASERWVCGLMSIAVSSFRYRAGARMSDCGTS